METCESCGRPIGALETPHVHDDHIICAACDAILTEARASTYVAPQSTCLESAESATGGTIIARPRAADPLPARQIALRKQAQKQKKRDVPLWLGIALVVLGVGIASWFVWSQISGFWTGPSGVFTIEGINPSKMTMGMDGRLQVRMAGKDLCTVNPVAASPQWRFGSVEAVSRVQQGPSCFSIKVGEAAIAGEATLGSANGKTNLTWTFSSDRDVDLACLAASMDFAARTAIGGSWQADDHQGTFPAEFAKVVLFNASVRRFSARLTNGTNLSLAFPGPIPLLVQDNRQWGPDFSIRIGRQAGRLARGENYVVSMTLAADQGK